VKRRLYFLTAVVMGAAMLGAIQGSAAAQNAQLPLPPTDSPPEGIPDLGGVWSGPNILREPSLREALGGGLPPFTPYGLERWESRDLALDPTGLCQPSGPGRVLHSPMWYQIIQTEGQVTLLFELYHQFHRVYTDGRGHPEPLDLTWWGSSIGRYEGNKLIVETMGLDDRSWLFTAGVTHSEQLRLTWVLEKTRPDTIRVTETFEDPVYFIEPWSVSYDLERAGYDMMEMVCTDNNRDLQFMTQGTEPRPY
jgi:hypothetical protein